MAQRAKAVPSLKVKNIYCSCSRFIGSRRNTSHVPSSHRNAVPATSTLLHSLSLPSSSQLCRDRRNPALPMAGDGTAQGSGELFDLEAKRNEDGAWHPCRVSLSSSDASSGVILEFEGGFDECIISSREDLFECVRFRSIPLQSGNCAHVKEGEYVLAMRQDQSNSLYFDAVVEKVCKVRHSNRVCCRCTFDLKWLTSEAEDARMTLPSKSIRKLSDRQIDSHPVVAGFLAALKPLDGLEAPSFLTILGDSNFESNFLAALEKQVEEISKLADGCELSEDMFLGSHEALLKSQAIFRSTTRNQEEEKVEIEHGKHAPFLSPLTVNGAVASSVNGQDLPISQLEDKEKLDELSKVSMPSSDGLMEDGNLTKPSATWMPPSLNSIISKDLPSRALEELEVSRVDSASSSKHSAKSVVSKKLNANILSRITHSAAAKRSLGSATVVDRVFLDENCNSPLSTRSTCSELNSEQSNCQRNTALVTHSAVRKQNMSTDAKVDIESWDENLKSPLSATSISAEQTNDRHAIPARVTRSAAKKQALSLASLVDVDSSVENSESPDSTRSKYDGQKSEHLGGQHIGARITRSAAKKQMIISADELGEGSNQKLQEDTQDMETPKKNENNKRSFGTSAASTTDISDEPKRKTRSSVALSRGDQGIISSQDAESLPAKRNEESSVKPTLRSLRTSGCHTQTRYPTRSSAT